MQIPKDKILEMLQQQGTGDRADQAKQQLPDQVDLEEHSDLLQKFGINPQDELLSPSSAVSSPACRAPAQLQQRPAAQRNSSFANHE